ncbi:MAG: rhodanese-like domain-containing protein, partial [Coriobacteriia bacterium]|nr:rhodanese-like domain-containing protein [Coriobacteriia bacterium]
SDSGSSSTGSAGSASTSPQTISAQQAKAIMDSGDPYILVDVRTQSEYDSGHIAGAVLIPVDTVTAQAPSLLPDKSALIMVYCRSGVRATDAANQLAKLGYTNVYNLGGIISWPYGTTTD